MNLIKMEGTENMLGLLISTILISLVLWQARLSLSCQQPNLPAIAMKGLIIRNTLQCTIASTFANNIGQRQCTGSA